MNSILLTTIAAVLLVGTAFADPIHDTARYGDLAGVQAELDKGVGVNATNDWDGSTPLHGAAEGGHKEVVELLIDNGADVSANNHRGDTPLHNAAAGWPKTPGWAASGGHTEVGELLIAAGADVNAKDEAGGTPLDWADGELSDLLRKHGGKTGAELL